MKHIYLLIISTILFFGTNTLIAQTIWTGPIMTFSKEDYVDWELEENQDRMTDNVWITRADTKGIFNIVIEVLYADYESPADTEWAYGTTDDIGSLTFSNWQETIGSFPPAMLDEDMVIHLITDDIYIDIKFLTWTIGGGGGFSWERSTDQTMGISDFELSKQWKISPNPSSDFITISGLTERTDYKMYNVLGEEIYKGMVSSNENIDIQNLNDGLYFIKLNNGITLKLIKK